MFIDLLAMSDKLEGHSKGERETLNGTVNTLLKIQNALTKHTADFKGKHIIRNGLNWV